MNNVLSTNYDNLFDELNQEYEPPKKLTEGEKVIQNAESQFMAYSEDEISRRVEIAETKEKIKELQTKLNQTKNVKNSNMIAINEKRSQRRIDLKKKIEAYKLKLTDIEMETKNYYKR